MNDGFANIIAEGCDAGIRLGQSLAEHMTAVPITPPLEMAVVATPDYFARHGLPQSPAELTRHNLSALPPHQQRRRLSMGVLTAGHRGRRLRRRTHRQLHHQ